jgi:DNA-binding transcriptional MocR family regulator
LNSREIPIIEDDIYGNLYFGGSRPKPLKTFDTKGLVLYCSSFSKALEAKIAIMPRCLFAVGDTYKHCMRIS